MTSLSLQLLGGAAADGAQSTAAGGHGHAGAGRKHAQRFGEALGQALAKHAVRAAVEGEASAVPGAPQAVEVGADKSGTEGRPAHLRHGLPAAAATDAEGASSSEAEATAEGADSGDRARRAPARKRPTSEGHPLAAEAPPVAAGHAAVSTSPGHVPLVDPSARLASRAAAKGPLGAPSPAKPQPASGPAREKAREREAPKADGAALATAAREQLTPPTATPEPRPAASRAAASQPASAPLPAPAAGHELQGGVLRSAAHLTIDAGTAGSLELHLRLRDGSLHLRVEGEGARALEARSGELSRALAGEGLKLAPIELGGADAGLHSGGEGGRGFEERRDAWQEAADAQHAPAARPSTPPASEAAPQSSRGIHVEA